MEKPAKAAIVTTLRDAGAMLDSFIRWHLETGFVRLYLFFDDPNDPDLQRLKDHPGITAIAHDAALRQRWTALPDYSAMQPHLDSEVMARQVLNAGIALELARRDGMDWLLHIDSDELFYSPLDPVSRHFAGLEGFDVISYANFEAVPEVDDIADPFRAVDLFKVAPSLNPGPHTPEGEALLRATPQLPAGFHFHFYDNGKSALRVGAQGARPEGVHRFVTARGAAGQAPAPAAYVLHYACCGFEAFWGKYRRLGGFPDHWFDAQDIRATIGPLHLDARDIVASGDREAALAFYRQRIAIKDRARAEALIGHGVLMRIAEPKKLLASGG
jgi:hypothetical protein